MAFNGSGTFNRLYNWVTDRDNSITITASRMDAEQDGIATGLSTCITKDGQTILTANIPFAGYKITGLGNGSARDDSIALGQVQDGAYTTLGTSGGSANTYTATPSPVLTAYATGSRYNIKFNAVNTEASTLNVNGVSADNIKKYDATGAIVDLDEGDIQIRYHAVLYDGTQWILLDPAFITPNKNFIINGMFDIAQRGATQTSSGYGSDDRWNNEFVGYTATYSQQSFTIGKTDVPGEPESYAKAAITATATTSDYALKSQRIEGVRTLAGQTATLSFYAKASGSRDIATEFTQVFGGGSSTVTGIGVTTHSLTTSWQKFTATVTIPSISGKTIGSNGNDSLHTIFWLSAGSDYDSRTNSLGHISGDVEIANVKLEKGSIATDFIKKNPQEQLADCQRYYFDIEEGAVTESHALGQCASTTVAQLLINFPVIMRTEPTFTYTAGSFDILTGSSSQSVTGLNSSGTNTQTARVSLNVASGLTAANACVLRGGGSSGKLAFDAEI